jgi:O-antigen ligase
MKGAWLHDTQHNYTIILCLFVSLSIKVSSASKLSIVMLRVAFFIVMLKVMKLSVVVLNVIVLNAVIECHGTPEHTQINFSIMFHS